MNALIRIYRTYIVAVVAWGTRYAGQGQTNLHEAVYLKPLWWIRERFLM